MARIEIESDAQIEDFFLLSLENEKIHFRNKQDIPLQNNWYELFVPFVGQKTEITDIKINNISIGHLLYTGYFENWRQEKFQPATAVWEPGHFRIWIHPLVGYHCGQFYSQIRNSHFGSNLFEKYLLTVDRPVTISTEFPEKIRQFFSVGEGPKWWAKDSKNVPYKILDGSIVDQLANDIHKVEEICKNTCTMTKLSKGWHGTAWRPQGVGSASPESYTDDSFNGLGKILKQIGWKQILSVTSNMLDPHGYIPVHIDDYTKSKNLRYIEGPSKLYYTYEGGEDVLFKLAGAGFVESHKPVLLNTNMFPHAVVNPSDRLRKSCTIYGVY